ncbi:MAG: hypothetical protein ABI083_05740 [Lapillicoccus sp.]
MSIRLVVVLASLALVTACGSTTGSGQSGSSSGSGQPGSSGSGQAGSSGSGQPGSSGSGGSGGSSTTAGAGFPVTISRIGGIAGFHDRVVVASGGVTTVTTKRGPAGTCTLAPETVTRLLAAVRAAPTPTPSTGPQVADELVTTLEAPLTKGPVRLPDATSADLTVVGEILADVIGNPPAYRLCTTP